MKTATMIFLGLPLIAIALVLVPMAIIWALNTLFPLDIPFTLKTATAVVLLALLLGRG